MLKRNISITIFLCFVLAGILSAQTSKTKFINVNTASLEQLCTVPGIGPITAKRIIEKRPYSQIDDLQKVKGIGSGKRFLKLIQYLVVSDEIKGRIQD
jgi:DNA uptake protein ComE-like DNA-binding protein